jgi:hypothetical protein
MRSARGVAKAASTKGPCGTACYENTAATKRLGAPKGFNDVMSSKVKFSLGIFFVPYNQQLAQLVSSSNAVTAATAAGDPVLFWYLLAARGTQPLLGSK